MDQLLLDIHPKIKKSFDNFITGQNKECINSLKDFISNSNVQFIYLWGEGSCGKTHLRLAVESHQIKTIDDIHLADQNQQIEIFNLFNQFKEANKKLLITGADSPNNMNLIPELSSRLSWGLVYQIKSLTDNEKIMALKNYVNEKNIAISENVIDYCYRNLRRDLHSLMATFESLDHWSLKTKRPVTIPLLKDLINQN
jgi:DnaA family protein